MRDSLQPLEEYCFNTGKRRFPNVVFTSKENTLVSDVFLLFSNEAEVCCKNFVFKIIQTRNFEVVNELDLARGKQELVRGLSLKSTAQQSM